MMNELPLLQSGSFTRRKEWVVVGGHRVCLWELMMPEDCQALAFAERPSIDPRGGYDKGELALWQIAFSCYNGDGEDAERIWPDHKVHEIKGLPERVFKPLIHAINRLNGEDPTEEEIQRDFIAAAGALEPSE